MQKQQEVLLYGGVKVVEMSYLLQLSKRDDHLYRLDLKTLQWSTEMLGSSGTTKLSFAAFSAATFLFDSVLVVYGGLDHTLTFPLNSSLYKFAKLNNV